MRKIERYTKKIFNASKACLRAAQHIADTGELIVSREEYEDRVNTCMGCEYFEKYATNECGDCLCIIKSKNGFSKAWIASEYCPQFKWKGDDIKAENL
jgi:hypothetical protein